ncbi:hypothetical protein [Achromobacter kerstersii]|uniref:Uncharacterized protein n=1 Tax=Achromobacter kerstersii TaxID=1353890 RepID=A0A6S6ZBM9_9BURK|nr:hypothetical protein [Achromobacter kerstersii]CAB3665894.1 hypothetical protein LMG3441_00809 [Achromobacter kerstersii]
MKFSVKIDPDVDGYTGRECPVCEKYFKIKFGTGLPGDPDCHCPYCNHSGPQNEFWTKRQIEFAQSDAMNQLSGQFLKGLKKLERRPDPRALVSIGISVKGRPTPIVYYKEDDLEERVTCSACTMEYTIYGAFGFCPDCGTHNSLQIANANFDLVLKVLDLAQSAPADLAATLINNALEDAVSCFDGFGREHCAPKPFKISFQSIDAAKDRLLRETGFDLSASLDAAAWIFVSTQFQKRHLLAHKLGIIDAEYIGKTGSPPSLLGRKVTITDAEVRTLIGHLRILAGALVQSLPRA